MREHWFSVTCKKNLADSGKHGTILVFALRGWRKQGNSSMTAFRLDTDIKYRNLEIVWSEQKIVPINDGYWNFI